jgi:hypothetical protein
MNPANDPEFLLSLEIRMGANPKLAAGVHELFRRGELHFMLHDGQRKIARTIEGSGSKEFLVLCSRQFGKSFFGLVYALTYLQKNPRTKAYIFAGTNKDAMDIVNDNLSVIQRLAPQGWLLRHKTERRWFLTNESQLRIGSLEEPDATRGRNCNLVLIEEGAAACSSDQFRYAISSVIGPMLLRSKSWRMVHITTPSKDLNHSVHADLIPKLALQGALARFTIHDNPQLTAEQIKEARDRCLTEEDWRREYLVELVRSTVLTVVPEFEPRHVVQEIKIPDRAHWTLSLDQGGIKDKHGILIGYYDFAKAKHVIVDELLLPVNTASKDLVPMVHKLIEQVPQDHEHSIVADTPGQVRVDLANLGLYAFSPKKKQGSFEAGVNYTRTIFKKDEIEIHERCVNLIAALNYGQFNKTRTDFARTEALGHCDMIAALIYFLRHQRTDNPYPDRWRVHKDTHYVDMSHKETSSIERMLLP